MQQTENDKPRKSKGCPILRQIYVWYPTNLCMVFYCINIVQKYKNKERSKTMRNLTKPCINLSEYWTSIEKVEALACLSDRVPRLMWITTSPGNQRDVVAGVVMVVLKSDMKSWFE